MFRTIPLISVFLVLATANSAVAQKKPFKNKIARAAQKTYEETIAKAKETIAKAKKEYIAKLEIAVKEAGGKGDLEQANRIASEKKNIETGESDPLAAFRRRLTGTKWYNTPKRAAWNRFDKNNVGISSDKARFFWVATTKNTVVMQYVHNLVIYVWHFDDKVKAAKLHSFKKTGNTSKWWR